MAYVKTNWVDNTTPIDKNNLNKIESGIKNNDINIGEENYDNTKTYEVGDIVRYNEKIYKCITAITTAENFDISKWEQTNIVEIVQSEKSKIYELIEAISTPIVGEGENITLNDTAEKRFEKFDIEGNSKQETREGYNLLPPSKQYTYTNGNVKLASDGIGKYTMNGDGTVQTESIKYTFELEKEYTIKNNDYLHIMNEGTKSSNAALILIDNNDEEIILCDLSSDNRIENLSNYAGKTIKAIQLYMNPIKVDITLTPMIINNVSTAKNFEQYGAMPSPDYPSQVVAVGSNGSVKVTKCNKNILPFDEKIEQWDGAQIIFDKNEVTVKPNASNNMSMETTGNLLNTHIKKGTVITESVSYKSGATTYQSGAIGIGVCLYYSDGTEERFRMGDIVNNTVKITKSNTITLEKDVIAMQYYTICYMIFGLTSSITFDFQIEVGETATPFEQHEEQSYILPVQQEMLEGDYFDFENEEEVHVWKKHEVTGNENWIKSSSDFSSENIFSAYLQVTDMEKKSKIYCSYFKNSIDITKQYIYVPYSNILVVGISRDIANDITAFKTWLKAQYDAGTPVIVYYKLQTPTRLAFTDEQKTVAKKLNNARTYKNVTHIYSNDEVSPNFYVEAVKDLTTLIQ